MLVLGIETSVRDGTIALVRDGELLDERQLEQGGRRHAQTLVAEIDRLLTSFDLAAAELDLTAVSIGPGSFTGLRVGVVCAKTLAYAAGCRLAAVDTLAAVAEQTPGRPPVVHVVADAQGPHLHVGRYVLSSDDEYVRDGAIEILPGNDWFGQRGPGDVVTGPGIVKIALELRAQTVVPPAEFRQPRAATVAWLGERRLAAGQVDETSSLEPVYVRKSAAEEKWDAAKRD